MIEQARLALNDFAWMQSIQIDRAPRLIERIKIEARWILLTTSPHASAPDATTRRAFLAQWPNIRNARLPADEIARHFYDIAADQAAALASLIVARRNKNGGL
jgi:hypothetical protein